MIIWAKLETDGCVYYAGISKELPTGAVQLPRGVMPSGTGSLMYTEEEGWAERPLLPDPVISGNTVSMSSPPEGLRCIVIDFETQAQLGSVSPEEGELLVELPDPGVYRLEFETPRPFQKPEDLIFEVQEEET